jgi:hypothetical protein
MIYNGASGRAGVSKPSVLDRHIPKTHGHIPASGLKFWTWVLFLYMTLQVIICYLITIIHSLPFWRSPNIPNLTFAQWTSQTTPKSLLAKLIRLDTFWEEYVQVVLIPLVSAVCTSPEADVMNHPMEELLGESFMRILAVIRSLFTRLFLANVWHTPLCCSWRSSRRCSSSYGRLRAFPPVLPNSGNQARH